MVFSSPSMLTLMKMALVMLPIVFKVVPYSLDMWTMMMIAMTWRVSPSPPHLKSVMASTTTATTLLMNQEPQVKKRFIWTMTKMALVTQIAP